MQTIEAPTKFSTIEDYTRNMTQRAIDQADLIDHAKRQEALGFTSTELSKRTAELGTLFSEPHLQAKYAAKYPKCAFLPWSALHMVRINLNIGLDTADNYRGSIPATQLSAMEVFDMESAKEDSPGLTEFVDKMASAKHLNFIRACAPVIKASNDMLDGDISESEFQTIYLQNTSNIKEKMEDIRKDMGHGFDVVLSTNSSDAVDKLQNIFNQLKEEHRRAVNGYVMLAPFEAFRTGTMDLVERIRRIIKQGAIDMGILKKDPLALKFVKGGALVVAAWGNEADELNRIAQERFELDV